MIDGVNTSVLQTASPVRANSQQVSTANDFAANPKHVQKVQQAPFVSPYISVDVNFDKAVIQLRDSDTGDVIDQFPSKTTLEARVHEIAASAVEVPVVAQPREQASSSSSVPAQQTTVRTPSSPATATENNNSGGSRESKAAAITAQQQAAFQAAAQSGVSNAGNVTLFA